MDNVKIAEELVKIAKELTADNFHTKDDILRGITFEDLIIAVQSNEKIIDEDIVWKVYKAILRDNEEDARSEIEDNMERILKECKI